VFKLVIFSSGEIVDGGEMVSSGTLERKVSVDFFNETGGHNFRCDMHDVPSRLIALVGTDRANNMMATSEALPIQLCIMYDLAERLRSVDSENPLLYFLENPDSIPNNSPYYPKPHIGYVRLIRDVVEEIDQHVHQ